VDKTFILHFGPHKTGTTWLWAQLSCNAEWYAAPRYKEGSILHWIHDQQFNDEENTVPTKGIEHLRSLGYSEEDWVLNYVDYYCKILENGQVTSDITCANYFVDIGILKRVCDEFGKRGVRVIGFMHLREPVTRLNSIVRHYFKELSLGETHGNLEEIKRCVTRPEKILSGEWTALEEVEAMRYWKGKQNFDIEEIYTKLKTVFGSNLEFIVFEKLFNEDLMVRYSEVEKIETLIGKRFDLVEWTAEATTSIKNKIPKEWDMVYTILPYKKQYVDCKKLFGKEVIDLWEQRVGEFTPLSVRRLWSQSPQEH